MRVILFESFQNVPDTLVRTLCAMLTIVCMNISEISPFFFVARACAHSSTSAHMHSRRAFLSFLSLVSISSLLLSPPPSSFCRAANSTWFLRTHETFLKRCFLTDRNSVRLQGQHTRGGNFLLYMKKVATRCYMKKEARCYQACYPCVLYRSSKGRKTESCPPPTPPPIPPALAP